MKKGDYVTVFYNKSIREGIIIELRPEKVKVRIYDSGRGCFWFNSDWFEYNEVTPNNNPSFKRDIFHPKNVL